MKLNQVFLIGYLTRDAELKKMSSGKTIQSFTLAMNDDYKNKDTGEWVKRPYFFDCYIIGKEYEGLNKGRKVCINGKVVTKMYQVNGANKKYVGVEVYALDFMVGNFDKKEEPKSVEQEEDVNQYVTDSEEKDEELPF